MSLVAKQIELDLFSEPSGIAAPAIATAIESLATDANTETRGAVFTRPEIVDFILDLAGYTPDQPLYQRRILEPSFGAGDFLLPIIDRLIAAWWAGNDKPPSVDSLCDAIRAVELHHETYEATRALVIGHLQQQGMARQTATTLTDCWLLQDDYLLAPIDGRFDFAVGNPPYVRQESIPTGLMREYRSRYQTIYDRADLYIPFIERSLRLLAPQGRLGFICADRWMKNRYGGPLRRFIAEQFHLQVYVDMVDTPAFHSDVIAYPAITIIGNEKPGSTRVAYRPTIDHAALSTLVQGLLATSAPQQQGPVRELAGVTDGAEPWLLGAGDEMALIRRLERQHPSLEQAGCKVGIGVATGADQAFIGDFDTLDVEPDRKLPLVTTKDIQSGEVHWRGQGVINPFKDEGGLVDLRDYPRLRRYLEAREAVIKNRHCARKSPSNWYRTIDRINPSLRSSPKLLVPDIKGEAHVVYEEGTLYPHHNLYYITAATWDLKALQAVLLSSISRLFVATYSTKMRGGYLRFQAQYLRRIHLPYWRDVPNDLREALHRAADQRDLQACNQAVYALFGLSREECLLLAGITDK